MKTHIVKRGDSLWAIATKNGMTVAELQRLNNTTSTALSIGQVLNLEEAVVPKFYVIKKGDTVSSICSQFGIDAGDFKVKNSIVNNALYLGRPVRIDCLPSKFTVAPAPVIDYGWNFPVLPWFKYNNNVGKFLDQAYLKEIGAQHPGNDINGNGGGNTDLNDNIYSMSRGLVVDAGFFPVWGNMVKMFHPHVGMWSVYGHLNYLNVKKGQEIERKYLLGGMGRGAGNRYISHLHVELRVTDLATSFWPTYTYGNQKAYGFIQQNYRDVVKFLYEHNAETS